MKSRYSRPRRAIDSDRLWALIRATIIVGCLAVIISAYATAALG